MNCFVLIYFASVEGGTYSINKTTQADHFVGVFYMYCICRP